MASESWDEIIAKLDADPVFTKAFKQVYPSGYSGETITDADQGRSNVTRDERDRRRFKTSTLRNVELTQPYFHDGSIDDLHEAVRIMLKVQVGKTLPTQDVDDIVAFLKTLTGTYEPVPVASQ
jgi:cytochrome c peroxidase